MDNAYFISSPLHLFIAANLSIQFESSNNVAVILFPTNQNFAGCEDIESAISGVFNRVLRLEKPSKGAALRKTGAFFEKITSIIHPGGKVRIFTGNDRRLEFQYAMHFAETIGCAAEGIYMDEGIVSYIGHKSMHTAQHRYLDPLLRKLIHGFWWKDAKTTGASAWIESAYVAFPELVHPLLKEKKIYALDTNPFKTEKFLAMVSAILGSRNQLTGGLRDIKAVLTLPHEAHYIKRQGIYNRVFSWLSESFRAREIAIKAHPRITHKSAICDMFPGANIIDSSIGMELLLPQLANDCVLLGDVSSTLLTTRWLRPDLPIVALRATDDSSDSLSNLYSKLEIPIVEIHNTIENGIDIFQFLRGNKTQCTEINK